MNNHPPNHENPSESTNGAYLQWTEAMKDFVDAPKSEVENREPRKSISETIGLLRNQEMEHSGEFLIRPKAEIICDHDHIEGQRIDIVNQIDKDATEFRFKLRNLTDEITAINSLIATNPGGLETPDGTILRRGHFDYSSTSSDQSYTLCDANIVEKDGMKIYIADPTLRNGGASHIDTAHDQRHFVRTAMGLVKIEIPNSIKPEVTESLLEEALSNLGVPSATSEVPKEAEEDYKLARYKWQHNIGSELTAAQIEQAENLEREEVFPGYSTFVERGKHKEYLEKYGDNIRALHGLATGNTNSIYRALTRGLMSTTERYSRGIFRNGMSSNVDMNTGGADSVFTRILTNEQVSRVFYGGATIAFKPEIFDRTDWYSYDYDQYGSTENKIFSRRLSPDEIFKKTKNGFYPSNEQMFRTGIGPEYIESIRVNADSRDLIIAELKSMGLSEFDDRPIEEVIIEREEAPSPASSPLSEEEQKQAQAEYEASLKRQKEEQQAKIQAIISGEQIETSMEDIIDLAVHSDNPVPTLEAMINTLITTEEKDKLIDNTIALVKDFELNDLQALATGGTIEGATEEDLKMLSILHDTLGIDYGKLYEEVKNS